MGISFSLVLVFSIFFFYDLFLMFVCTLNWCYLLVFTTKKYQLRLGNLGFSSLHWGFLMMFGIDLLHNVIPLKTFVGHPWRAHCFVMDFFACFKILVYMGLDYVQTNLVRTALQGWCISTEVIYTFWGVLITFCHWCVHTLMLFSWFSRDLFSPSFFPVYVIFPAVMFWLTSCIC